MITLDDFELSAEARYVLESNGVRNEDDLIETLELYKFVERKTILNVLRDTYPRKNYDNIPMLLPNSLDPIRANKVAVFESKYNCLVEFYNLYTARIIVDTSNKHDIATLSVQLDEARAVEIVYITPVNFQELKGVVYTNWNYDIMFRRILIEALDMKATDIHIDVKHYNLKPKYVVEYRVDNLMTPSNLFKMTESMNSAVIHKLIETKTNAISNDLRTIAGVSGAAYNLFADSNVSLRITANQVFNGFKCVCRIQTLSTVSKEIGDLGFSEEAQIDLHNLSKKTGGLTLVTGGIRTGKNTTAFAIGNEMVKDPTKKIVDYSSPIEVLMPFSQVDYKTDKEHLIQLVRLSKKQDVNVVFVNEIPDKAVAESIFDLVNSSVHVVTTTHLNRLWHLPHKMNEYFGSGYRNVLTQMNGCINQRMYNVQCPNCLNKSIISALPDIYPNGKGETYRDLLKANGVDDFYVNEGCDNCTNGRLVGIVQPYIEWLVFTDDIISDLLRYEAPFEMERYLKNTLLEKNHNLERQLALAIKNGKLHVESLDSIL